MLGGEAAGGASRASRNPSRRGMRTNQLFLRDIRMLERARYLARKPVFVLLGTRIFRVFGAAFGGFSRDLS